MYRNDHVINKSNLGEGSLHCGAFLPGYLRNIRRIHISSQVTHDDEGEWSLKISPIYGPCQKAADGINPTYKSLSFALLLNRNYLLFVVGMMKQKTKIVLALKEIREFMLEPFWVTMRLGTQIWIPCSSVEAAQWCFIQNKDGHKSRQL